MIRLFLLLFVLFITLSCDQKEDPLATEIDTNALSLFQRYSTSIAESKDSDCFSFVYPISFIMPNSTTLVINDEQGWEILEEWYDNNKDENKEPEIVFPFSIIIDDVEKIISNNEELDILEIFCVD